MAVIFSLLVLPVHQEFVRMKTGKNQCTGLYLSSNKSHALEGGAWASLV